MILVADNLQITNNTIHDAIRDMRVGPVIDMVKKIEKAGAHMIDINAGPLSKEGEKKMDFLVRTVQEVSNLPILLDTANPAAIHAGLRAGKNKMIINGFSLEPKKMEEILPLAVQYEVDIIGYLLDARGHVPPDASGRLTVAVELYTEFQKTGLDNKHLIIDPVIPPVIWQDGHRQAMEVLEAIRMLKDVMGFDVKTIAGVSNLTTGAKGNPKRYLLEQAYVSMLSASGLDMALLNIFNQDTIQTAMACSALTGERPFSWEDF